LSARIRRLLAGPLAGVLLLGAVACGTSVSSTSSPDGGLQQLVDRWRERADVPAVTLAMDSAGGGRVVIASGSADRGGDVPVAADSRFRVASITKMFVAIVVLQLVEEGRIRLDARAVEYLTGSGFSSDATVRQLLAHTSGIPDYGRTRQFNEALLAQRNRRWSSDELLALVAGVRPDFTPGTDYSYSNTGYIVLGNVVDAVTGSTWAAEVRRRIIDPLALRHTHVAGAEPATGPVIAGHMDVDNDGQTEKTETGGPWPSLETSEGAAGAIVSTAGDLATFADALFHGRLVGPTTLQEMVRERPHHPRNSNYGLGVEISRPDFRLTVWGHGGFTIGFRSVLWYVPRHDLTVVVLANDARANPSDLAELVVRAQIERG
jgi:D-alanyl-D-alanine carboxypeptidase